MISEGLERGNHHVKIEVAPGVLPALSTAHKDFVDEFIRNEKMLYFGIVAPHEYDEELLMSSVAEVFGDSEEGKKALERVVFIRGDATNIPTINGTVSEVLYRNFIGSGVPEEDKIASLKKAWESLSPGGVLTITEDNTPHVAIASEAYSFARDNFVQPEVIKGLTLEAELSRLSAPDQIARFRPELAQLFNQPGAFVARFKKPLKEVV